MSEAATVRSCLNIYYALRQVQSYDLGVGELRAMLRDEQLRWRKEYGHRLLSRDDEEYVEGVSQLLLNIVDARIRPSAPLLVRKPGDPLEFSLLLQAGDWLVDVYLHLAGILIHHGPIARCAATDCGRYFEPVGETRYHDPRCAARQRQQRKRGVPTNLPTTVGTAPDNGGQ